MYLFFEILKNLDSREKKKLFFILLLLITIFLLDILSIGIFFPIISLIIKKDFYINFLNFNLEKKDAIILFLFLLIIVFFADLGETYFTLAALWSVFNVIYFFYILSLHRGFFYCSKPVIYPTILICYDLFSYYLFTFNSKN